jgi:hypothetical protein
MAKYLMVDPPSGWFYGFPKVLGIVFTNDLSKINFNEYDMIYEDLLKLSKYPLNSIGFAKDYSRYWIEEIE